MVLWWLKWDASMSLYSSMWNSEQMTIGKTHPTLLKYLRFPQSTIILDITWVQAELSWMNRIDHGNLHLDICSFIIPIAFFDKSNDQMLAIFSGMILKIRSNRSILPSRNIIVMANTEQLWDRNMWKRNNLNIMEIIQSINRIILAMIHKILAFRSRL